MLSAGGVDCVQVTDLAQEAGVTRPVVYRYFTNRQAILAAVLEEFEAELSRRFLEEGGRSISADVEASARAFVDVFCDTIEARGVGPWHLLAAKGPDPEIARIGQEIQDRMMAPWIPHLTTFTGGDRDRAKTVARMLVAMARAVVDRWVEGEITRAEAAATTTRAITGLLGAFAEAVGP